MSRLTTSFVLGYHGCDTEIAHRIVNGGERLLWSERDYDWLGSGSYFWESDPERAMEWAETRIARSGRGSPAVVGAAIDLGNCLDLSSRTNIRLLQQTHAILAVQSKEAGRPLPANKGVGSGDGDRRLRFLDCAVINQLHLAIESVPPDTRTIEPFDTVRGMFTEGPPAYGGCGFTERAHTQIAVRNPDCIKGVFFVRMPSAM